MLYVEVSIVLLETSWIRGSHKTISFILVTDPRMILMLIYLNSLWPSGAIWRQVFWSTLAQVMASSLTTPIHYLNQCWLLISGVLWHSHESNFTAKVQATNLDNEFEDDLSAIYFKSLPHLQGMSQFSGWTLNIMVVGAMACVAKSSVAIICCFCKKCWCVSLERKNLTHWEIWMIF